jgi:outer membrane protein assembly factor BamB
MPRVAVLACVLFLLSSVLADDNWPAFRGGSRAGVGEGKFPDAWDAKKNIAWQAEVPGRGWSSPVVWGKRVFVTSVISDEKGPEPRKGLYISDLKGKVPSGEHRWLVHCYDLETGKSLWQAEAHKAKPSTPLHIKNTFASETPVTDGQRVYAYFGNVGLFCFDQGGKQLWSKTWEPRPTRMGWGMASSPALHRGVVYVQNDNEEKSFLAAIEAKSGKVLWEVERSEKSNWASPFIWENDQRTEIVTAGSGRVRSYDTDGKLLWELQGMSMVAIPTPFAAGGLLYVTSGYVADFTRPLYAIRPGAKGDITLESGTTSSKDIAWCQRLAGPYHPTPIVYGEYLYVLYDRGLFSCFEAKTGKPVYEKKKLDASATAFTASPWAADGKVFCLSEDGDTFVVKAGAEFQVLGKNSLDEMCLATPALAGGNLLIRTLTRLYCIRK